MFVIIPLCIISCSLLSEAITIHSYRNTFMVSFFEAPRCSYYDDAGYSHHGCNCVDGMGLTPRAQSHRLYDFFIFRILHQSRLFQAYRAIFLQCFIL